MRDHWAEAFTARAESYWTVERTEALTRGKRPLVLPGEAPVLFRAMGLLHRDASMPPDEVRKWRQINHMVAILQPSFRELMARFPLIRLVDAGCGKAYLTMMVAWVFKHRWNHPVQILGVDRNADLMDEARRLAEMAGLSDILTFEAATLEDLQLDESLHGVLALHACDTATDDALGLAIRHDASMVAVAPCCQAQLAAGWRELSENKTQGPFEAVWASPHLRRTTASDVTDTMRVVLLRAAGFDASAIEFVPSPHTPKNTLIRGLRVGEFDASAFDEYVALKAATGGVGISLERQVQKKAADHSAA